MGLATLTERAVDHAHAVRWRRTAAQLESLGENVHVAQPCYLSSPECASIGSDVYIGPHAHIAADDGLTIGRGVMVGPWVYVQTSTHRWEGGDLRALPYDDRIDPGPVTLGDYVWIGGRVAVLPGVTIGEGAVVGAGSVVASDIDPLAVVVGNPARQINERDRQTFEQLRGLSRLAMGAVTPTRTRCVECGVSSGGFRRCGRCLERLDGYKKATQRVYGVD